ncbi:MAG: hypothetical protein KBG36_03190 [Candidatus Marinimicrobia bacterium]|jgi:Tfp pilus assembly protein PilP|nr:hypothetical protein [Candidatus Neomarinimicrobiota bacterium]
MFNRKLRPGQQGTKKLVEQYGERLLNVRYIYNAISGIKMKTVELVEEQKPWTKKRQYIPPNKIMHLKVEYDEVQIRNLVKSCGGRWNKEKGYWEIAYRQVQILGLENRILNN